MLRKFCIDVAVAIPSVLAASFIIIMTLEYAYLWASWEEDKARPSDWH